ncbi:MAG: V-type ATP synthase subunit F [Provencibacterium sp.]|jgi:V/A-type H+-transporting ATPase subunit F|nr:V-type ATP synthase subunit F [Provencibacterium sp.]
MRKKIAIIGDKESVLGYKAVGFHTFVSASPAEDRTLVDRLAKDDYGVIFITEQALSPIVDILEKYKDDKIPAIIPLPSKDGTLGLGIRNVKSSVERAVGADILFND